jgi:hypothetical protein
MGARIAQAALAQQLQHRAESRPLLRHSCIFPPSTTRIRAPWGTSMVRSPLNCVPMVPPVRSEPYAGFTGGAPLNKRCAIASWGIGLASTRPGKG